MRLVAGIFHGDFFKSTNPNAGDKPFANFPPRGFAGFFESIGPDADDQPGLFTPGLLTLVSLTMMRGVVAVVLSRVSFSQIFLLISR